ncbi:MAG: hypothetical protein CSH49_07850 [Alcanivorax sp.]|nr:MAG: hypothetical protein CSH49_07850 [Alcanivorax sp.]
MAVQKAMEGHANLYVMNMRRELKNLFEALVEIENVSPPELFEAMLYPFVKNWVDQRERNLDTDEEVMESLHHAIDEAFINQTVMHRCLYKPISEVPSDQRKAVLAKMARE